MSWEPPSPYSWRLAMFPVVGVIAAVAAFYSGRDEAAGCSLVVAFMAVAIFAASRGPLRKAIDEFDETGNRSCPKCFYDLRTLPSEGNCPECGEPYSKELLETARERLEHHYRRYFRDAEG